jgi:hypothetical protein
MTTTLTPEAQLKGRAIREGQRAVKLDGGRTAFVNDDTDIILAPYIDRNSGRGACWMIGGPTAAREWIDSRPEPPTQPPGWPREAVRAYWLTLSVALLAQEQGFHVAIQTGGSKKHSVTPFALLLGPDDIEQTRDLIRLACEDGEASKACTKGRGFG